MAVHSVHPVQCILHYLMCDLCDSSMCFSSMNDYTFVKLHCQFENRDHITMKIYNKLEIHERRINAKGNKRGGTL